VGLSRIRPVGPVCTALLVVDIHATFNDDARKVSAGILCRRV
jgi:hypothetical protein